MVQDESKTVGGTVSSILGDFSPQAFHCKDKKALVWANGTRTYGELRDRSLRLAAAFRAMNLKTGDRVATLLLNRGEVFEVYFACAFAGLTHVPISFRLTGTEIAKILDDSGATVVLTEPDLSGELGEAISMLPAQPHVVTLDETGGGQEYETLATRTAPLSEPYATDVQAILYTSGSTGEPKGVPMRSLGVMWCAMQQITQFRGLNRDAVMLVNAPLYNTAGINESSIPTFLMGGTVAIMPSRQWSADRFAGYVSEWGVTHTLVFPAMFKALVEEDGKSPLPLSTLKWWYTGGENCPPELMAEVRRRWPDVDLAISYGSTEAGMATFIEGNDIGVHAGSVGRCVPGQAIRLHGPDGRAVESGEVGDVWTSGPAVVDSYWNAPELDRETIRGGWLKVGDLARMDEDGWIYIVGRSKDLVISKGQNIYPAEVENAIRQLPEVSDTVVVGIPDEEYGEIVCAAVVLAGDARCDANDIRTSLRTTLASYKRPRHIVFVKEFPMRNETKVDKRALVEIVTASVSENESSSKGG